MYQEGKISIVKCKSCGEEFAAFTFVAVTDMVTSGCVALTGYGFKIALTMQKGNERIEEIESRIGSGYKIVSVKFVKISIPDGLSFQEFSKLDNPYNAIYSCIRCGSDSYVIRTEEKEKFLTYGEIEVVDG
jgi:hypothetical protein